MKQLLIGLIFCLGCLVTSHAQSHKKEIKKFQKKLNKEMADPKKSPLPEEERKNFTQLEFFPRNEQLKVKAKFVRTKDAQPFEMQTTTSRKPVYEKYGEAIFEIDGKEYKLNIYQSHRLRAMKEHRNHLFLPFTDLTSGVESYGGGRYIDLEIPKGDFIIIDFNKAYNPYCAYNYKYSCPIPPKENDLAISIKAGVKAPKLKLKH